MDLEITALAFAAGAALGGALGTLWGRGTVDEFYAPSRQLETLAAGTGGLVIETDAHVHECNHYEEDGKGWRCYLCWKVGTYTPMERAERNRG
jgi:hypothetical protein